MSMVLVTKTVPAAKVRVGDMVTYCGETFSATMVRRDERSGLLRLSQSQYVAPEREVTVRRYEVEKPYVVLTRRYLKSGECRKGRHTFATKSEQRRFMDRTTAAITYYSH